MPEPLRFSFVKGNTDRPLLDLTIGDQFDRTVERFPNREALVVRRQRLRFTYRQLRSAVDKCARGLLAAGLQKGERLGILSPNTAEWAIIQFAASKIGVMLVNLNPAFRLPELGYVLRQSGCSALVLYPRHKTSDYTRMILELAPELLECPPGKLRSEKLPSLRLVIQLGDEGPFQGLLSWKELSAMAQSVSAAELDQEQKKQHPDDPINIQYTSGTTGRPKGAVLSHRNILNNGYFTASVMNLSPRDRLIIPVPLYHCFGMVMGNLGCMSHGAAMVYPGLGFDPKIVLRTIEEEKGTALFGVPTMFFAELEHPEFEERDLSSLRTGIMAGSPCPVALMEQVRSRMHMKEVEIAYGMTETSPVSFQTRPDSPVEKRVGTVGRIHPHIEAKIVSPATGETVPIGEVGELRVRGYSVMLGYWKDEAATREAIDSEGWMRSGDLAVMDEEGYVKISGRIKDVVIRGGENIYPREIEDFLFTHPAVSEVQVFGVPDEKYGETVIAWVKLRERVRITGEELRDFCREQIAHYKIPRYIKFVEKFPMTVTGKIQKFKMREESIREFGLEKAGSIETARESVGGGFLNSRK